MNYKHIKQNANVRREPKSPFAIAMNRTSSAEGRHRCDADEAG